MVRTTFRTSRELEFFTEKELQMQIGHSRPYWAASLLKELIDNSLDACENSRKTPRIKVVLDEDSLSVEDNGPGISAETLASSLDYMHRVSDKNLYISPTRGQLGNALKCVWAAPFVATGKGRIEVRTQGRSHSIEISLNEIEQKPEIKHLVKAALTKNGTFLKVYWEEIAGYLGKRECGNFYKSAEFLLESSALFNPHARFELIEHGESVRWEATSTDFKKWTAEDPISAHWYTPEEFRGLVAAEIAHGRKSGVKKTVRDFVSDFRGLKSSTKQAAINAKLETERTYLEELANGDEVDKEQTRDLLEAMKEHSRAPSPALLGTVGQEHVSAFFEKYCDPDTFEYRSYSGKADGLPYAVEFAFAEASETDWVRGLYAGLNFSPTITPPCNELIEFLGENLVDRYSATFVFMHLTCPKLDFRDRGKSSLQLPKEISDDLSRAVRLACKEWKKKKKRQTRTTRPKPKQPKVNLKDAAYIVMEEAYQKASDNGTLPANARQVMYAARPMIQEITEGKFWKNSATFTQSVLPEFLRDHPDLEWDIAYDDRGHFREPHTGREIGLGTLNVRRYIDKWSNGHFPLREPQIQSSAISTVGPQNRYRYVLFIEKEGFYPIFEKVGLSERWDIAIMSTKGQSVTAARHLVEQLSNEDVTILVLHDFDKSGLEIVHDLSHSTRRFQYDIRPNIIDLGLRLADVEKERLQAEEVQYRQRKDPKENLRKCGATREEADFLVKRKCSNGWTGHRVELNAMTSRQFINWLENKLSEVGVRKTVPEDEVLQDAFIRACRLAHFREAAEHIWKESRTQEVEIPTDIEDQVLSKLGENPHLSWDQALETLIPGN